MVTENFKFSDAIIMAQGMLSKKCRIANGAEGQTKKCIDILYTQYIAISV